MIYYFTITVRIEHPLMRDTDHDFLGATPEFNWPLHWETDVRIRKWRNATHFIIPVHLSAVERIFSSQPNRFLLYFLVGCKTREDERERRRNKIHIAIFPPFFLPSLDLHIWSSEERGKVSHGGLTPNQKWWDKKGFGTVSRESEMLKQDHLQAIINR